MQDSLRYKRGSPFSGFPRFCWYIFRHLKLLGIISIVLSKENYKISDAAKLSEAIFPAGQNGYESKVGDVSTLIVLTPLTFKPGEGCSSSIMQGKRAVARPSIHGGILSSLDILLEVCAQRKRHFTGALLAEVCKWTTIAVITNAKGLPGNATSW